MVRQVQKHSSYANSALNSFDRAVATLAGLAGTTWDAQGIPTD